MSADLDALFTAFEAHLTAAGAAQDPPIVQVIPGEPGNLTTAPIICYWLLPIEPWEANTLNRTQKLLRLHWQLYIPGSLPSKSTNRSTELRLASFALALEAQLMGDVSLGGAATGGALEMSAATPDWTDFAGVMCRGIGGDVGIYLAEEALISA